MIYDIIIIGCGPTGAVLSLLLARQGLSVIVIEKEEVYPVPRATHIDEETLRNFQMTGLMDELIKHTQLFGSMEIIEKGKKLFEEEIVQPKSVHGYTGSRFFDQPQFEIILRKAIANNPYITFIKGDLIGIMQDDESVSIEVVSNNEIEDYTAKYLVGCDGGRSTTRTIMGIDMYALEPARDWIIVDSLLKNEADAKLLPNGFCYYLEKEHLSINAHGVGLNRRWEFQLNKGELQPNDEIVKSWVAQYIDLDKIEITRIAKYAHNSLVAERWKDKRVFLAGDAAHMMPPSAGQGLCSGVRDAVNLAWKLNEVIKNNAPTTLLDTYEQERKTHLHYILKRTLFLGNQLQGDTTMQQLMRSIRLRLIESINPFKNYLRKRFNTPPPVEIKGSKHKLIGQHLPQFESSDDIIGYRFALVAKAKTFSTQEIKEAEEKSWVVIQQGFDGWLDKQGVSKVFVRPDKVIERIG